MEVLFILIFFIAVVAYIFTRPPQQRRTHEEPVPAPDQMNWSKIAPRAETPSSHTGVRLRGKCWVIDGDTIVIDNVHVRLAGIDAPELDHPYGKQAKYALVKLCKDQVVTAFADGSVSHNRVVARCVLPDGRDLAAEMVKAGLAIDWTKHSGGGYRHLETADARKRLWRATHRQKGRFPPPSGD